MSNNMNHRRFFILGFVLLFLFLSADAHAQETVRSNTVTTKIGSPTSPAPIVSGGPHPVAPVVDPAGLRQAIIDKFDLTLNGYDNNHLKWAWEKFWEVSNTNFIKIVRGSVIVVDSNSRQVGCPGGVAVYLDQYTESLFKYAIIHELGHVIRNCPSTATSFYADHLNALNKERGVTYYANNAPICTGSDNPSEDYAEMIARYLSPGISIQLLKGNPANGCNPPAGETINLKDNFPMHYNVARSILGDF